MECGLYIMYSSATNKGMTVQVTFCTTRCKEATCCQACCNHEDTGVHSKRVPSFILPEVHLVEKSPTYDACRSVLSRSTAEERRRVPPEMMVVQMTEQRKYLAQGANCRQTRSNVLATAPSQERSSLWRVAVAETHWRSLRYNMQYWNMLSGGKKPY